MSSGYEWSLINQTDPSPYAQVIVLAQSMINDAFQNMWILADDDSPMKHFKKASRGGDSLDVYLGAPNVSLQVTTRDPELYYYLVMNSGKVKLYLSDDPDDDSNVEWPVNNWVFAFSVKISRKMITKDSEEYKQFKDRAGLSESNFSLAQLYIDTSSTTKWDKDKSNFGDKDADYKNLPTAAQVTFEDFVDRWVKEMNKDGKNIVGYSAQADDSDFNAYAPTFPPTSIDYATYPWLDPNNPNAQMQDNSDLNALSYLMMTNFDTPPRQETLNYSGTFVDGNGIFCMNNSIFWDSWLLKLLQDVARGMELVPDKPYVAYDDSDPDFPWQSAMEYHVGNWDKQPSDYTMNKSGDNFWYWSTAQLDSENIAYGGGDHERVHETSINSGQITFSAGQESVTISGNNTFTYYVAHGSNEQRWTTITFTSTWQTEIALSAVDDGGVIFSPVPDATTSSTTYTKDGPLMWRDGLDAVAEMLSENLSSAVSSALSNVDDSLINALDQQHKLFLPAAGTFLMKDPKFNKRGDLLVALEYNGADPPQSTANTAKRAALLQGRPARPEAKAAVQRKESKVAVKFKLSHEHALPL